MDRTVERVREDVTSGAFTRGAQVVVIHHGRVMADLALGDDGAGRPVTPESVFRVYCSIKPVVALAVARAIRDGLVDLDEPLEAHLPAMVGLRGGVTARHVLTHTAGLHRPPAPQMEVVPPEKRRALLERMLRPQGWQVGVDAGFSEYTGWFVLGWLLEKLTGEPLREHLRATVLDPLTLADTWIGMTERQYRAIEARLGVTHDLSGPRPMPMLLERSLRWCTETNPAHGGYSTATDLARFYMALLDRLGGAGSDALPSSKMLRRFTSTARPPVYDQALGRVCPFGLGFMTSLGDHFFGDVCTSATFGHSGYIGASFAFADPFEELVIAVIYNGIVAPEFITSRRIALVKGIYADLGLGSDPAVGDRSWVGELRDPVEVGVAVEDADFEVRGVAAPDAG